jgi:outer membrane protein assembly factor BamB
LSEHKGNPTRSSSARIHHLKMILKKLFAKYNDSHYESFMNTTTVPERPRNSMRWWIPASIIALAIANVVRIRAQADLDGMSRNLNTLLTVVVSLVLLVIWWLFLSGLRWRVRLTVLGVVVLCALGFKLLTRTDGSHGGNGKPRIVWRWTPGRSGDVGKFETTGRVKAASKPEAASDYPGYLGRDRSGVIVEMHLERDWTGHPPQELWRRPIGLGWSAFATSGPYAFTQEQRGENELVVCYELATGVPLWSHTNRVRFSEPMGGDGPRATPTVAGGKVYALGATGILDCLDTASGKLIWTHETLKDNGLPNTYFGKTSSPLLVDDLVVVTGGMSKKSTLLAFRCADGSPAWQSGTDEASFTSPTIVTLDGIRQILSVNASSVTGNDPKDGRVLWEYEWPGKLPKCAQPVALDGGRIFVSASFNAGCLLLLVKKAPDGRFTAAEIWKNRNLKSEFSNVVARDGFLYGLDDGILACIEVATGERKWKDGRYGHGQVLLVGDLLLVQTEQGPVALVEADPSGYREVAKLSTLGAKTWNTPALAGDFLLVRNDQEAACYRLPAQVAKATSF